MNLFEKYFYIFLVLYFPQSVLSHGSSHYSVKTLRKTSWSYLSLYRFNFIYPVSRPRCSYFLHDDHHHYYRIIIERMTVLGEHPICKEFRYIRIYLVVLGIVLLFLTANKSLKFLQITIL